MGTLWRSCAKVREPIELPLGVVSRVGSVIGALDGGSTSSQEKRGVLEFFYVYFLVWDLPLRRQQRNSFSSCAKT